MLVTSPPPIIYSFTKSDISGEVPKTSIQQGQGDPKGKKMSPSFQTGGLPLNGRDIESPKIATFNIRLSIGVTLSTETTIRDFLYMACHLPLITDIKISSPNFNPSEIQNYQEDLDLLLACLHIQKSLFSKLKTMTFGEPPQPYIHVKEFRKPETVTFRGIMFSPPPQIERHRQISYSVGLSTVLGHIKNASV